MSFIDHTHIWARGEAVDMIILAITGCLLLILTFVVWQFINTSLGNALIIPLMIVSLLFIGFGIHGIITIPARMINFSISFEQDPIEFIRAEHARLSGFADIYRYTLIATTIGFIYTIGIFAFTDNSTWRAIGIMLAFVGLSALIIDSFSKERASRYISEIETELERYDMNKNLIPKT